MYYAKPFTNMISLNPYKSPVKQRSLLLFYRWNSEQLCDLPKKSLQSVYYVVMAETPDTFYLLIYFQKERKIYLGV